MSGVSNNPNNTPVVESETRGQHNHDHFYYSFPNWVGLVLLAVLTLIIFGHILVAPNGSVISAFGYDLSGEFVYWREFGFRQLRSGNIPLWNPHALCGVPFFGSFQSALLYPPNALFLLLPLNAAINWSVALHVYLAGVFTFLWTKNRGLHPLACLLSSIMFMFGAPYFLHIFAGHLSNLCTMVWTPLVFLAVDKLLIRPSLAGCLLGIFAASMSILAGHVQYVFYTAVVAALYCLLDFTRRRPSARVILYLLAIGVGAIALTAIQSFTGLQEGAERLRSQGTSYDFSSMFSFPPENFLTVLAPWFFGDMKTSPYWGRCYLTEMSLFISVTGLVLAIYGAIRGAPATRRFAVTLTVVTLILALGAHTPIFNVLYHYVPGFSMFRGMSKFVFAASLFIALLAGIGLDVLLKGGRVPRPLLFGTLVLGIAACGTTFWLSHATMNAAVDSWWPTMIRSVQQTGEIFMQSTATSATFDDPAFPTQAGGIACKSLLAGGATLLVVSIALFLTNRSRRWAIAFVVLVSVELLIFASTSLETFMLARCKYPRVLEVASQNQGDYRILNLDNPNSSLVHGTFDIWGDDPGILKRYGEFLGFSQGIASQDVRQFIPITNASPIFAMLRARFIFPREAHGADYSELKNQALPHVLLVSRYRVMTNRTEILSCLTNAAFNPREEVILETAPQPTPEASADSGTAKVVDSSTDYLTIEANVKKPAILLITDSYSRHWRARNLMTGPGQSAYEVMPANYCLRGIPLSAGQHYLRLEYAPSAFTVGKWVSVCSVAIFCALVGVCFTAQRPSLPSAVPDKQDPVVVRQTVAAAEPVAAMLRSQNNIQATSSRQILGIVVIVALLFLVYAPSLTHQFLWDDDTALYQNPLVKSVDGLQSIWFSTQPHDYWPLTYSSFWLEWRLWGENAIGYRVVNILLHALGVFLLWRVLSRLRMPGARWAAIIFAVHPVCVASVAWIAEQKNTLSLVFFLLSILFYSHFASGQSTPSQGDDRNRARLFYGAALFTFILALLSKTSVVALPFILLICIARIKGAVRWKDFLPVVPFLVVALGLGLVTVWFQKYRVVGENTEVASLPLRLAAGSAAIWFYLFKAIAPFNLSVLYNKWPASTSLLWYLPAAAWCVTLYLVWRLRKRIGLGWLLAFLYFTACLLPVVGIFNMSYFKYSWVADHLQYLAVIGIVVVIVAGVSSLCQNRPAVASGILGGIAVVLGILSFQRAALYGSAERLWQDALNRDQHSWAAANNLGSALDDQGRADEAARLYSLALQINPNYPEAHNNLAMLYAKAGKETDAAESYAAALRINPNFAEAHNNLGGLLLGVGKLTEAKQEFVTAARLRADYADPHYNSGLLLEKEGKPADALREYAIAVQLNPSFAQAYYNAGNIRVSEGDFDFAARLYKKAVESQLLYAEAHYNLASALERLGHHNEAVSHFTIAVRIKPELGSRSKDVSK